MYNNISDEDKKTIDDFIEKYQDNEYFLNSFFGTIESEDILSHVNVRDYYQEFGEDLLDEFDDDDLISYLENNGYKVTDKDDDIDLSNGSIENQKLLIDTVCQNITSRYLTKEDRKNEINDFIDFWF